MLMFSTLADLSISLLPIVDNVNLSTKNHKLSTIFNALRFYIVSKLMEWSGSLYLEFVNKSIETILFKKINNQSHGIQNWMHHEKV